MLLVIFGAGASYDSVRHLPPATFSGPVEDSRPPLANHLFDNRELFVRVMNDYPDCKPLVNLLRGDIQVEMQLAKFEEEAKTYPVRRAQLMAIRYYLHHMLWMCQKDWTKQHSGINNYATFLDAVRKWCHDGAQQVCLVTFNYDTMLEQCLEEQWGLKFDRLSSYIADPRFKVIKPHGSIDWGIPLTPEIPPKTTAREIIDAALDGLNSSGQYHKLVSPPARFHDGTLGLPAIAIPVDKKDEFVCPEHHVQALAAVMPQVRKVITIGWRATERRFLDMLNNRLTGLQRAVDAMVVSGNAHDVNETYNNLRLVVNPDSKRQYDVETGFSGLIKDISVLENFLSC